MGVSMNIWRKLRRWTVRSMASAALASALLVGGQGQAQYPQAKQLPKITYTKNTTFHLPVQMDDKTRTNLREVCLYVKINNGDWVRHETGIPTLPHFRYQAQRDGEYWFSLATIDKSGKMTPADLNQEPPGLRVVVDTQAPALDVQPHTTPDGDLCLRCRVLDANPDLASLRATYQTPSGEASLDPVPGQPGLFRLPPAEALVQTVRFSVKDLCGNVASREVNVRDMAVAALQNQKNQPNAVSPTLPNTPTPNSVPANPSGPGSLIPSTPTATKSNPLPATPVTGTPNQTTVAQGNTQQPELQPTLPKIPALPTEAVKTDVHRPAFPSLPNPNEKPALPQTPVVPPLPAVAANPMPPAPNNVPPLTSETVTKNTALGSAPKQIINTTHATVEYRIDSVGPSGVGKVEVYLTGDAGQTWHRLAEDADRRSPANIELPGEGLFGVRLVVTNGNGFGGTPPNRGEAPTCWIEVDTTAPFIQLRPIDPAQNGVLEIRWTASDKNLGPEPINLFYRTRSDGPWQVLARGLKNEGLYRWTFPRDQGSQFFVKAEVVDQAGNAARAETPNPIVLDITEPRASVVGVTGMGSRATAPAGN